MWMLPQPKGDSLLSLFAGRIGEVVRPRPMLQLALGIVIGISLVEWSALPAAPSIVLMLVGVMLALAFSGWAWLVLGLALGAVRYELWRSPPVQTPPPRVVLRAIGMLEPTRNGYRLLCAFEQPALPTYALVYFRPDVPHLPDYGDVFRLEAVWRRPVRFSGFDWARYLERRRVYHITTVFSAKQFEVLQSGVGRWQRTFSAARQSLRSILRTHLAPENAALIEGMLVGAAGDFPPELREAFHRSGIGHLLATSGLHVMMALQMVYLLLRWTPIPFTGRIGLVIAAAWGYALLAGLRPSIVRAATMTTCALCAPLLGREADSLSALGFAGALWLLIAPHAIFEVGFQYSFSAVLFILLFYTRLERTLRGAAIRLRLVRDTCQPPTPAQRVLQQGLIPLLSVTLSAQAGISMVQLYHFGSVPLLSPLANLLAVPAAYPTLALGFWFWLSQGVGALPLEGLCAWLQWVARTFGAESVPALHLDALPAWLPIACYTGVLLLAPEPPLGDAEEF